MKIIGFGNALVDVLALLKDDALLNELNLPRGGMQLIDDNQQTRISAILKTLNPEMATGGSAGNTILALAKVGVQTGFVGRLGNDEMGHFFADKCKERGIEARVVFGPGMTGVANTFISPDGERTFATYLGEAALAETGDVTPATFDGYDLLHIEGYLVQNHAFIEHVMRTAKACGLKVSIDLASYNVVANDLDFFRYLVQEYVDIVFANEEESAAFTHGKAPAEALVEIGGMCEVAVVKLGKRGSSAMCQGETCVVEPCLVDKVVDTTAAGDFFAGGFLYGYANGFSLERCLWAGSLLGSKVIQVIGTQVTEETWREIVEQIHK